MLDQRSNSILYQSQTYLVELVDGLVTKRKLGKALDCEWDKADQILALFEAWTEKDKFDDITQTNYSLDCLIKLAELNQFPVAPTFNMASPPALIAEKGEPGAKGPKGDAGQTGYATDVQTILGTSGIVDSFSVTDAKAARWEYVVTRTDGISEQRSGIVRGTWSVDGSDIDFFDNSTNDINGPTDNFAFDVQINTGNIQLVAIITGGTWLVQLSRFFTPANGNGSGPISNVLPNGLIYIGNVLNEAQAQAVSGVINITNLGITTFPDGVITNAAINNAAAIEVTKFEALAPSRLVVTDGSGYLTTLGTPSLLEVSYIIGASSNIQDQIDALGGGSLTDPMTTVGDVIIRNGSNVTSRLGIGSAGQVLTVSGGLPVWQSVAGATPTRAVDIGDWNMNAAETKTVTVTGIVASKLRTVTGAIRTDSGSILGEVYYQIAGFGQLPPILPAPELVDNPNFTSPTTWVDLTFTDDDPTSNPQWIVGGDAQVTFSTTPLSSNYIIEELTLDSAKSYNYAINYTQVVTGVIVYLSFWTGTTTLLSEIALSPTGVFSPPAGTDHIAIRAFGYSGSGVMNIQNISIREIGGEPVPPGLMIYIDKWTPSGANTQVVLRRASSGSLFQSVNFDATSYNRGWLIVTYVP